MRQTSVTIDKACGLCQFFVDGKGAHHVKFNGHPWSMQGMDALELGADHGDGHFALLTIDMTPNHIDTIPLPQSGSVVLWKYRPIYRVRDQRVGNWSQVLRCQREGDLKTAGSSRR